VSRYNVDANEILVTGYKFIALQWRGQGLVPSYKTAWDAGAICKTCDKPINFIVRVMLSFLLLKSWRFVDIGLNRF